MSARTRRRRARRGDARGVGPLPKTARGPRIHEMPPEAVYAPDHCREAPAPRTPAGGSADGR